MLIVFTNTKGGVGKSTLAAHLTVWLYDQGFDVAMLDSDEQQTAAQWVRKAEPAVPVATATSMDEIRTARFELAKSHNIIVADSPGSGGDASQTITLLADMAIIPLQPSKPDVRAVKDALKFVRLAQEMSGGKKPEARIVFTLTAKGDVQTRRLREQLAALDVPVARAEIRRLNAFRDACDTSVTRMTTRDALEAARDVEALFSELFADRIRELPRREPSYAEKIEVANG